MKCIVIIDVSVPKWLKTNPKERPLPHFMELSVRHISAYVIFLLIICFTSPCEQKSKFQHSVCKSILLSHPEGAGHSPSETYSASGLPLWRRETRLESLAILRANRAFKKAKLKLIFHVIFLLPCAKLQFYNSGKYLQRIHPYLCVSKHDATKAWKKGEAEWPPR